MDEDIMNYVNKQNKKFNTELSPVQLHPLKELANTIKEASKPLSQLLSISQQALPSPIFNKLLSNIIASIIIAQAKNIDEAIQNIKTIEQTVILLDKEFNKQKEINEVK